MNPRIEVLLLAAGRSSRTGDAHKLLALFDGEPLIRRMARIALTSPVSGVNVVVGYKAREMQRALRGLMVNIILNERFESGLSTSLTAGFASVAARADGVLVMLADQPLLTGDHLASLIEAFSPIDKGAIVVATDGGKRFNPVLISSSYLPEIASLQGDVGARSVVAAHSDRVREVEIGRAASFDVDTREAILTAGGRLAL